MQLFIADTYEEMSRKAATDVISFLGLLKDPLISPASGDTPAGLYKELAKQVKERKIDTSGWSFAGLDEWAGMNGNDEGSCRFHLNNQLFDPLGVSEDKISFFDGRKADLNLECERIEHFIAKQQGIDIIILGLGMNGHAGMNEPGTSFSLRSHITDIDSQTQQVGQKYFKEKQQLSKGVTLGLATILDSKNILLMVSGQHKAKIVKQVLEGEISEQVPASILRSHPGLRIYLDKGAASLLQTK